jgi:hypothetical protein
MTTVLLVAGSRLCHAIPLFSLALDSTASFPRGFYSVPQAGPSSVFVADLGTTSDGFSGLTYSSSDGMMYTVRLNSSQDSVLASFAPDGSGLKDRFTLGLGADGSSFNGGLTFIFGTTFFAIKNDSAGNSTLDAIDSAANTVTDVGGLGVGFAGGMTYVPLNTSLYAISNGSILNQISLTGAIVNTWSLPITVNGGLFFDSGSGLFFAIGPDNKTFAPELFEFSLPGPSPVGLTGVGDQFNILPFNAGLTGAPAAVPEPSTGLLLLAGLGLFAWARAKITNQTSKEKATHASI